MKNKILLTVIIFIGLVSNISPQQKYRNMAYLNQSLGGHIYSEGVITNVPAEVDSYNIAHGYIGNDAVTITKDPNDDYPPGGNQLWLWWDAFRDAAGYSFVEDFLETGTYSVIMVKNCFVTSDIWFYWYEGPQDTINYPHTHSIYNFQWYIRKIARKMEQYPEKFFVWWNLPPIVPTGNNPDDAARLRWLNKWMVDTLATGLDTLYGAFPQNIYVYDYFELVDSANFLPLSLADGPEDSHPNAACSELVAPDFVQKAFDAAIAYESNFPVYVENNPVTIYVLEPNFPNPFNPSTEINFSLAKSGNISLIIYDLSGSEVDTLVDGFMEEGKHSVIFNARGLNSGVYFYRLKTDNFTSTRKMLLLK